MSHVSHESQGPASQPPVGEEDHLARGLSNRHIQLIAIGGAIGTGLFMGSGQTISAAGPSILLIYLTIGGFLFFVMRAMGELLLFNLQYKSFQDFARDQLGAWAGFVMGWTYWLCWIVTGIADIVAISGYVGFWTSVKDANGNPILNEAGAYVAYTVPQWIPALILILLLLVCNLLTVTLFGEIEFWFALIKLVAIFALILTAVWMVITGFTNEFGTPASVGNIVAGGIFPNGVDGFLAGFQIAVFAFVGIELVGTTAAETRDPTKTLPRAINAIPIRVLIFYVGALMAIMAVTPWYQVNPNFSPFVSLFVLAGIGPAAAIVNFVVLTAAASSANSGIFSTSRMMYGLAEEGQAPRQFKWLSNRHVPARGLLFSVACLLPGILLLYASGTILEAFTIVTTFAAVLFMVVWSLIVLSYMAYRKNFPEAHATSIYKMPFASWMPQAILAFFVFIVYVLTREEETRNALLVTPIWFVLLAIVWFSFRRRLARGPERAASDPSHRKA